MVGNSWDQTIESHYSVLRAAIPHQMRCSSRISPTSTLARWSFCSHQEHPVIQSLEQNIPVLHEPCCQCSHFQLHGRISCYTFAHFLYSVDLIRPGQISQIPIRQPSPHLRLTDMDQIPLKRIIKLIRIHHLPVQQSPLTPPHLPTPLFIYQ